MITPGSNPADVTEGEADLPLALPITAVSTIRFCRACGTPWDAAWERCPHCVGAVQDSESALPRAQAAAARYQGDVRTVKHAVGLYFSLLAVSIVSIIAVLADKGKPLTAMGDFVATGFFCAIIVIFCCISWREIVPLIGQAGHAKWYPLALICACVTYLIAAGCCALLELTGVETTGYSDTFLDDGYGWGTVVLLIAVQPAIFEELAFRGVIQTSLTRVLGSTETIWVSALMFGILHLSIPSMPHLLVIGVALGWLRVKTGSLYPGMLLHFVHNLLVILSERSGSILPW